jgi:2',3'-cyclic-nucleotide 2'-phosphodiesterase (5'-nucleotidase family)/DNA-binding beta-propeller fold protein YncE
MPRPLRFLLLALLLLPTLSARAQQALGLEVLGTYATGVFDEGAAEIVAYDRATQRLFFVNADAGEVQALDISDPANPTLVLTITAPGGGANSVAVKNGIVAVAVEAEEGTDPGSIRFYSNKGALLGAVTVGVLPDAVAFSEDGRYVVVANEGEPNDDYTMDPEGSISVIDLDGGIGMATVTTVGFGGLTEMDLDESVRIFGPDATIAQDLEPEYVAVEGGFAYVTLQENNAVAVVELATGTLVGVEGLGFKDWSDPENLLDASNDDDGINIQNWPVSGIYQPDAIATYEVDGQTYIVSANEGDARDYDGFSEEARVRDLVLDPAAFPNAAELQQDENLGRLNITTTLGFTDAAGLQAELEGEQEVPEVETDAEGTAYAILNDAGDALEYSITVEGLDFGTLIDGTADTPETEDDVVGLHIHSAERGANGAVVFGIVSPGQDDDDVTFTENADGSVTISGVWDSDDASNAPLSDFVAAIEGAEAGEDVPLYLNVHTTANPAGEIRGQLVGARVYDELYAYGARSFSIWTLGDDGLELVYDSADDFEQITAMELPAFFNSNNDDNDSFDSRSDDKGPEPEGLALGEVDGRTYAFVGLERIGGVMVYDVTDPAAPAFVTYTNNRDFSADAESPEAGDLGPEGLVFIPGADSPTGQPLLAVSNEVSGTVTLYGVESGFTLAVLHNNDGESDLLSEEVDGFGTVGGIALFADVVETLRADDVADASVLLSSGDNFLAGPEFNASLEQGPPYYDALGLSRIGYDALAIGNHEFDFGPDVLAAFIASFPEAAPFLSATLDVSGEPALASLESVGRIARRTTVERGGRQIGIIGATTPALRTISSPRDVEVLQDVQAEVQAEIDALQAEGVGIIILISHLQGTDEDLALIEGLRGLDIVIAGGGDDLLANDDDLLLPGDEAAGAYPLEATDADGDTVPVVTTAGGYGYVGRLVVEFDAEGEVVTVLDESGPVRVAAPDGYTADAEIESLVVAPVEAYVADLMTTVIGETEVPLDGRREAIRFEETNLGDLIADALLWQADELNEQFGAPEPDVALIGGGGIRNDDVIPAGELTEFDTFDILPFSNFLTIVEEIPAAQFKTILENAYSRIATGPSPSGSGRFAQVAGFTVLVDTTGTPVEIEDGEVTAPGTRIERVELDDGTVLVESGEVVDGAPPVNIATVDFTARGGDEYLFGDAELTILGVTYQQTLSNYIQQALGGLVATADYPEGGNERIVIGGTTVPAEAGATPVAFSVDGVYPNPFARTATLAFGLPADAEVEVRIYDVLGREVLNAAPEAMGAGSHTLRFDANGWASGVYVYRLTAEAAGRTYAASGRMTVVR